MARHPAEPRPVRGGFTLIEMLVVIGIILILATLTILVGPSLANDHRTTSGASRLQGWLLISKQRAFRDQAPRGVRLLLDPTTFHAKEMVYIERPEDWVGSRIVVPSPLTPPVPPLTAWPVGWPTLSTALIPALDLQTGDIVLPGDFLVFDSFETSPYNAHRICEVTYVPPGNAAFPEGGTVVRFGSADPTPNTTPSPVAGAVPPTASTPYRITRQPRPMAGEQVLQMPRGVVVDFEIDPLIPPAGTMRRSILPTTPAAGGGVHLDVLFSPRGQIMGSAATTGKIVLWVRNGEKPLTYGDQILITVTTKTGMIGAHPAYLEDPTDYYRFTRDGKSSGM